MNLNLPTAAVFCALVNLALGIGMWLLWNREKLRYLLFWSTGFFCFWYWRVATDIAEGVVAQIPVGAAVGSETKNHPEGGLFK